MIYSVKVTTKSGLVQTMELGRPAASGLLIRSISGLTPGAVDLKMTDYATLPGSILSGSRKPTRNVVIDMIVLWSTTVEQCRHKVERLFKLGEMVRLDFVTEERECFVNGVVESNDPDIFNGDGLDGVPCQISIVCPDPRIFDIHDTVLVTYSALQNGFTFPANITSETPIGILESENKFNITYDGTEDEGVIFTFVFKANVGSFKIRNVTDDSYMLITPYEPFISGDILTINTKIGEKSIIMKRNGLDYNYMSYYHAYESEFVSLRTGTNSFIIESDGVASGNKFTVRVTFTKAYWGI